MMTFDLEIFCLSLIATFTTGLQIPSSHLSQRRLRSSR